MTQKQKKVRKQTAYRDSNPIPLIKQNQNISIFSVELLSKSCIYPEKRPFVVMCASACKINMFMICANCDCAVAVWCCEAESQNLYQFYPITNCFTEPTLNIFAFEKHWNNKIIAMHIQQQQFCILFSICYFNSILIKCLKQYDCPFLLQCRLVCLAPWASSNHRIISCVFNNFINAWETTRSSY